MDRNIFFRAGVLRRRLRLGALDGQRMVIDSGEAEKGNDVLRGLVLRPSQFLEPDPQA